MEDLKNLWRTVFGDSNFVIDSFFETFYSPALTAVQYENGKLAAAAYVMPAGYLINGSSREKCAHIYAVAVYPEHRGKGYGISVTNKAVELAHKAGFSAVVLHPASESLFGFYEKYCEFYTCFSTDIHTEQLQISSLLSECDEETYLHHREKFLCNIPHIELNFDILSFFRKCGGSLYISETGCAAVENYDGISYIREHLGSINEVNSFENCISATPGKTIPVGMIHKNLPFKNGWLGLTLE